MHDTCKVNMMTHLVLMLGVCHTGCMHSHTEMSRLSCMHARSHGRLQLLYHTYADFIRSLGHAAVSNRTKHQALLHCFSAKAGCVRYKGPIAVGELMHFFNAATLASTVKAGQWSNSRP